MDHMSPYFAKHHHHHHHAHSHGHHSHRHHAPTHTPDTPTTKGNSYPTPTPSSCNSGLQTPVPRRGSLAHTTDSLPSTTSSSSFKSYNTPPTTPPLSFPQTQVVTPGSTTTAALAQTVAGSRKEPVAWCTARARIPTPDGSEYFLHIYENTQDKKEHLAFVFGDAIRSHSLDKVQPNETEMDRVKRGAYTGRLQPIAAAAADHSLTTLPLFQEQEETTSTTTTTVFTAAEIATMTAATTTMLATEITTTSTTTTNSQQAQKEDTVMTMAAPSTPLVRIHSECFTGEIGHSARCDCGEQLDEAIRRMKEEGAGVVVYLRQEGRGIGLGEKIK